MEPIVSGRMTLDASSCCWVGPGCSYWYDKQHLIGDYPEGVCTCGLTRDEARRQGLIPTPVPDTVGAVLASAREHCAKVGLAGDAATRKASPIASGVLFYFPNALAAVAHLSKVGNEQHNPGQPMHWAFDKSQDEHDCITRHLADAGTFDTDGIRHSAKVAWRALAALERELLDAHPELKPGRNVRNFTRGEP